MRSKLELDGARGEGGGQILRSALTLSTLTGIPFRIVNIRAARPTPGLRPQHLQSVLAAAAVSAAETEGVHLGSQTLTFSPRGIRSGTWRFEIGTAGATTLVLQTVFLPLCCAGANSALTVAGGTHVPWSPAYHYLDWHWLTHMRQVGLDGELTLERAGFYPRGGGILHASIRAGADISPLHLLQRGQLERVRILSAVSSLPDSIAERQRDRSLERLKHLRCELEAELERLPGGAPGTLLLLLAEFERAQACFTALGQRGKPAERVADEAVEDLMAHLAAEGALDGFLADQLLLPLAFSNASSEYTTSLVSQHLLSNAQVVQAFTAARIEVEGGLGEPGRVKVAPRS